MFLTALKEIERNLNVSSEEHWAKGERLGLDLKLRYRLSLFQLDVNARRNIFERNLNHLS